MPIKSITKRRICFVITSFIHYSRNFLILRELSKRKDVDLHVIIGGTALLSKYTSKDVQLRTLLEDEGCKNIHELYFSLEGNSHVINAKTTGLGIIEFSTLYNDIKPDLVVVRGDRFEVLAATVAAAYLNIPVAHIEGGDLSGTIDESVRHAITKFSHIHFVTNNDAKKRVIRMGENSSYVFNFGSPDIEVVSTIKDSPFLAKNFLNKGSGADIDFENGFLMVMYHPVLSESEKSVDHVQALLHTIHSLGIPTVWFWPNADVGSEDISKVLRSFNDNVNDHKIRFMRYIAPKDFIALLSRSMCLIGNSSAGLKECSFLGIPVVNIGSRQNNRLRASHVTDCSYDQLDIEKAIRKQLKKGRFAPNRLYYANKTAQNISKTLATIDLYHQKSFH